MTQASAPDSTDSGSVAVELERLIESARDSLSDDMVSRLATTLSGSVDLLDQVTRYRLDRMLPSLATLVENGDLERLVHLAGLMGAAEDSFSDDIVTRVSAMLGDGVDLLDRVNRSGIVHALPAITRLVDNGDLDRIVDIAQVLGSVSDSLSEDIVTRLAAFATEGMCLIERLSRNEGLKHLLCALDRPDNQHLLVSLANALDATSNELANLPAPKGGIGGLLHTARQPGTQAGLQILSVFGKHFGGHLRKGKTTNPH